MLKYNSCKTCESKLFPIYINPSATQNLTRGTKTSTYTQVRSQGWRTGTTVLPPVVDFSSPTKKEVPILDKLLGAHTIWILMLLSNQGEGGKWVKWEFEIFKFNSAHNFSTMLRNEIIYLVVVNITLSILQLQTTKPSYGVGDKLFKPVHTSYLHFFELLPLYFRLFIFMHTYFNNFYNWHICTLFLVFYFILF